MKVLAIIGHPKENSFTAAIAQRKIDNLKKQGHEVKIIDLSKFKFNPILTDFGMKLEPELIQAQRDIADASHLIIATPIWWSTYPAILKGFLDRVLTSGFAFKYEENGKISKLLKGKTAELILLSDAPTWYRKYIQRDPAATTLKRDILGFCGIKTTKIHRYGSIISTSNKDREKILQEA